MGSTTSSPATLSVAPFTVWGGNLCMLAALTGTPYLPVVPGGIGKSLRPVPRPGGLAVIGVPGYAPAPRAGGVFRRLVRGGGVHRALNPCGGGAGRA